MMSKVISPPFTRCRWITSSLESTQEQLKKNINITHYSPPRNKNLRNQLKKLDSGETKEKEERTRTSIKKTSCSHKSKSLACYGGLDSFFVVKSLKKACISQNCFTLIYKNKKL